MKSQPHSTAAIAIATGYELNYLSTLGSSQVTLPRPGQAKPLPATIAGKGGPAAESQDQSGFFGGVYYWQVPADLTSATVTITAGAITAESNWLGSLRTITVGSATFPLSFGAAYQPPPPPASPPPDAAGTTADVTTATTHRSSGGFPLLTLLVIPILVLIGRAGFVARRRHARKDSDPSPSPNTAPPHGSSEGPAGGPPPAPAEEPAAGPPPRPAGEPVIEPPFQTASCSTADGRSSTAATNGSTHRPGGTDGSARPPLLVPPDAPPEPPAGTVRVDVLGATSVIGWPPGPPPRQSVMEIMAFLVLHPGRRFTAEQIQTGLSIGRPGTYPQTASAAT